MSPQVAAISVVVWFLSLLISAVSIYTTKREIIFDEELYRCVYDRGSESHLRVVLIVVLTLVPLALILSLNVGTCSIAMSHNKTRGEVNVKAPLTVCCISVVLLGTVLPFAVYCLITAVDSQYAAGSPYLKVLSGYAFYINVFANPLIYTATNSRFYTFVKYRLFPCLGRRARDNVTFTTSSSRQNFLSSRRNSSFYLKSRNASISLKRSPSAISHPLSGTRDI